jgi:protein TonB
VRIAYYVATFLALSSFSVFSQMQTPNTGASPATRTNADGPSGADVCSDAGKGEPGHFAARFPWYVRVIRHQVSEKWLASEVDSHIRSATRVCLNFDLNRAGEPSNIRIAKSSGVPSLDESALRAVKRVSSFGPLPPEYERDKVSILFWFDYKPRRME